MNIRTGFAAGFFVLLAACGGGGGPSAPAPMTQKSILIEEYGDSTTVGCTATTGATATNDCPVNGYAIASETAPGTLAGALQQSFGPTVAVSNKGVAGITSSDLLYGTGRMNGVTFDAAMSISQAQIVTINVGLNDLESADDFEAHVTALVSIAKGHGKTVVLYTTNPVTNANAERVAAYRARVMKIADEMKIPVSDDYSAVSSSQWATLLSDGVHPTAQGYAVKGNFEVFTIGPVVASIR